jgi:hypothetical protein
MSFCLTYFNFRQSCYFVEFTSRGRNRPVCLGVWVCGCVSVPALALKQKKATYWTSVTLPSSYFALGKVMWHTLYILNWIANKQCYVDMTSIIWNLYRYIHIYSYDNGDEKGGGLLSERPKFDSSQEHCAFFAFPHHHFVARCYSVCTGESLPVGEVWRSMKLSAPFYLLLSLRLHVTLLPSGCRTWHRVALP